MTKKITINNKPEGNIIWKGLGGHFDSMSQIMNEFIDNSISNFKGHNPFLKQILIYIEERQDSKVFISIEDSGTGIKNIDSAFTLGAQDAKDSTLNEHGFGFKHALATANPDNDSWEIYTRTQEQLDEGTYTAIKASYQFENFEAYEVQMSDKKWPGQLNSSGTYISFECPDLLFKTVTEGHKGHFGFKRKVHFLMEDIGFVYSNLIKDGVAKITVIYTDIHGNKANEDIRSIEPNLEGYLGPKKGRTQISLDNNQVTLEYEFGIMKDSDNEKYYKRNMSTSGVEIRLNGRVIATNLFKEVWDIEKHNSYNYLLVRLNLISDNPDFLPTTRTSKNAIRKGDKKLEDLFGWVRRHIQEPQKSLKDIDHEVDLFKKLEDLKNKHLPDPKTVKTELKVFRKIKESIRIDLYVSSPAGVVIYEGKKDKTSVQDVYQLRMYWDGCIIDGITPDKAILIASEHPKSVQDLIVYINKMKDSDGNFYKFESKNWIDEGITYPAI